ncbi:MAG: RNA 2'-phosphotransferase [Candidatus Fonsibacter sp.]
MPELTVEYLAKIASSGTEDRTKLRWQFSVRLIKQPAGRKLSFFNRIQGVFGIRAVVGHTGMPFLEDDRLMVSLESVPPSCVPVAVHNTRIENLPSILKKGLIPGGGETVAVHSQLSAFHLMDSKLQESSRAPTTDVVIFFNVDDVRQ